MIEIIHILIFALVVVICALIIRYIVNRILTALAVAANTDLVDMVIGLIALLIILARAWPLISSYT